MQNKEIIIEKPIAEIYEFAKDPKNYLGKIKGIKENNEIYSYNISGFGLIDAKITNLEENKKVVVYSKNINTSLEINLLELEDSKTKVTLVSKSYPSCGLFKNIIISRAIPKVLNIIADYLKDALL